VHDEPITSLQSQTVPVKGANYRAYVVQRSVAFPQRSGELTIGPPKVTFDVGGGSLFDSRERVERVGVPVTVNVKPLPEPGPPGAVVGRYTVRASLDRTAADTGDAVTLRIDATGLGNLQDLRIGLPPLLGVRALQPAIRDQRSFQGGNLAGTRSWEWILIAEAPGEHRVPPIELHFFDPDTEEYGVVRTPSLAFTSSGAAKPPQPAMRRKPSAAAFGPIRMYSALTRDETPVRDRGWFAWLLAVPPMLFVLLMIGAGAARRRERRSATVGAVQRQLIRSAENALQANDPRSFYDRIVASITQHAPCSAPHASRRGRLRR